MCSNAGLINNHSHPTPSLATSNIQLHPLPPIHPTPLTPSPAGRICEEIVTQLFWRQKIRKPPGPDGMSPCYLKVCTYQLTPSCFKHSTIILAPKKPSITGLNDYRPVALMSVVMKSEIGVDPCWTGPSAVRGQTGQVIQQPDNEQWRPPGMCALPTALLHCEAQKELSKVCNGSGLRL